ncbi:MAG: helix-turn-helix domain-containing protein [Candidatus Doudnabacteria bacterium]|nr:helix-turn-helix domain-containing protein [Candidatus Doudnabacteria bacterium]
MMSNMVDNLDIKQNLMELGLDETEALVYIDLVNSPGKTLLAVSRSLNIPRTTLYRVCQSLAEKKFVEWVLLENTRKIKAINPNKLDFLVVEQKAKLEGTESSVKSLQKMLKQTAPNLPGTEVRYYQGKEGIQQIMWNALQARGETLGYSVFGRIELVGKPFTEKYNHEFYSRGLTDRVIVNKSLLRRVEEFVHKGSLHNEDYDDIRVIDDDRFYISGDTIIYNNTIALSFWEHGEVVGVEIENPELAKIQKGIFEILWGIGRPVNEFTNSFMLSKA